MLSVDESAGRFRRVGVEIDAPSDQTAVEIENVAGKGHLIIVCDHASNFIPERLFNLGLSKPDLDRHIAWDPGALGVSRSLSRHLDAPMVAGRVSRLVIDCNRDPSMFDSVPSLSEETSIPGNAALSDLERRRRVDEIYAPFHAALDQLVSARLRNGPLALVAIHSFTPVYKGQKRPWHVGILFDRDIRLAAPLMETLGSDRGLRIGRNEPYSPHDRVYHTLDRHGQVRGLPNVMVEIRNDLVATAEAQEAWGVVLASAIARALPGALATEPDQPAG
jgi:predicted N-formylglutamate amidohydrolase